MSKIQYYKNFSASNKLLFPLTMWIFSRIVIGISMLIIVPLLPTPSEGIAPSFSWDVFYAWDSGWYEKIATSGYEYVNDGKYHTVAFFPLYPLAIRGFMALGLPFLIAGTLVNNLAFLGAILFIYSWLEERLSKKTARWIIVFLVWFPLSIYGSVIYAEGLYLLLSSATLRAFEQNQYWRVALWGSLATATRPTGIALIPTFLIVAWREKRKATSYIASIAAGSGVFFYSIYCYIHFQDALAFVRVQKAWQPVEDFYGQGWVKMLMQVAIGTRNWKYGAVVDFLHPLLFVVICASSYLVWRFREKLKAANTVYIFGALGFILWLLAGNPLINSIIIFGGAYLLWYFRSQLGLVLFVYGFCSLGLIFSTGRPESAERYAYGIVSVAIAFGILLSRYPRWGYMSSAFFGLLLALYAMRFAQHLWVA